MLSCAALSDNRDGAWLLVAGLVLVRQKPGSAKGVMFITIEDETGVANLVVWPGLFENQRQVALGARMLGVDGQVQREGEVVHVVARRLHDLSSLLDSLGSRGEVSPEQNASNETARAALTDNGRIAQGVTPTMTKVRDIFIPDLPVTRIRTKPRDFR